MTSELSSYIECLESGQVGIIPAKNGYMLAGSGSPEHYRKTSARIRTLKGKTVCKPLVRVASEEYVMDMVERQVSESLPLVQAHRNLPIVWSVNTDEFPENGHAYQQVGLAIARNSWEKSLIRSLGQPIIASSANRSGKPTPSDVASIDSVLLSRVDFVFDVGAQTPQADYGVLHLPELTVYRDSPLVAGILGAKNYE